MTIDNSFIFGKSSEQKCIYSPIFCDLEDVVDFLKKLSEYDRETGETGKICVYQFMRMSGSRTPYGLKEYGYDVLLDTSELKTYSYEDGIERYSVKFKLRREKSFRESPGSLEQKRSKYAPPRHSNYET